jgi:uncharacterized protein YaeQ
MKYNTAGTIHFTMDKEHRDNKRKMTKITSIKRYLANKYNIAEGLAYADPADWDRKDKDLFIRLWVMDGYPEMAIRRMYKI